MKNQPVEHKIYKIMTRNQWRTFEVEGLFRGAPIDISDGYIHFSYEHQLAETAMKHFSGQADLVVVAVDTTMLASTLKAEPSRGGALFPHLYAPLEREAVLWAAPLTWREDGYPEWEAP